MYPPQPSGRGRLVAAILISLAIHGLVGYTWLAAWTRSPAAPHPGIRVEVDSPDDTELAINVRQPRVTQRKVELPPAAPQTSATSAADPGPPLPPLDGPGAVTQVGDSLPEPESSPKPGGPKRLHDPVEHGKTIVYLLDRSGSMVTDGMLRRAIAALLASMEQLDPDVRFQIVAYNGGTRTFANEPVTPTPENVERAGRWLAALAPEGGSKHVVGFKEAFSHRPDMVLLLTDADDLEGSDVRAINSMNRNRAVVMAAVFGGIRPAHETPLERLVRSTGGAIRFVER